MSREKLLKERRAFRWRLQAGAEFGATQEGALRTAVQHVTRKIIMLGRLRWRQARNMWDADLAQARTPCDLRQIYYVSRRLARRAHLPRKRWHDKMQTVKSSVREWREAC